MNRCIDCIHSKFQITDKGNIKRSVAGKCNYEVDVEEIMKMLPESVTSYFNFNMNNFKNKIAIWHTTESHCPVFKAKN